MGTWGRTGTWSSILWDGLFVRTGQDPDWFCSHQNTPVGLWRSGSCRTTKQFSLKPGSGDRTAIRSGPGQELLQPELRRQNRRFWSTPSLFGSKKHRRTRERLAGYSRTSRNWKTSSLYDHHPLSETSPAPSLSKVRWAWPPSLYIYIYVYT